MSLGITNWKYYSQESHDGNRVEQQLNNLLNFTDTIMSEIKPIHRCAHNNWENQQLFIDILWGYINDDLECIKIVREHEKITTDPSYSDDIEPIKTGICMNCIQQFIISSNGLNDIFKKWYININDPSECCKNWRSEFNNTNIIIIKQPIFLKCILLPSNIQCLTKIFNLFFVEYLQNTNLNKLIIKNESNAYHPFMCWGNTIISDTNINLCHGFEHSLSSLSTTINELIPLLKLHHIKHLFLDNKRLRNIAFIIDKFIKHYVEMPHIQSSHSVLEQNPENIQKFKKWRKQIKRDTLFAKHWPYRDKDDKPIWILQNKNTTIQSLIELYFNKKHPILRRFMIIFVMLYKKFTYYYKKLKTQNNEKDMELIKKLRAQRMTFRYLMYYKHIKETKMNHHCWSLVAAIGSYIQSNTEHRIQHKHNMYCTTCHAQQTNPNIRFKTCSICQLTYYCSRKCQKYDWNKKGHKQICKQLVASITCSSI